MTRDQKTEFEQRRLAVMRAHVQSDPALRRFRRKRTLSVVRSVLGSFIVFGMALLLIKSLIIAFEGPDAYASMVSPLLEGQAHDAVLARALGPDPLSTGIAAAVSPLFPDRPVAGATQAVQVPLTLSLPDEEPALQSLTIP
ncbi:hypothetical protein [Roseinatronobacter monicus]|uniref:hypothetical protein n=1 Tax=Roseinatronobacter monicus TaxID=393481 RepID=UPI003F35CF5C